MYATTQCRSYNIKSYNVYTCDTWAEAPVTVVLPGSVGLSCCGWGCTICPLLPSLVGGGGGVSLRPSALPEPARALVGVVPSARVLLWSALARGLWYVHAWAPAGRHVRLGLGSRPQAGLLYQPICGHRRDWGGGGVGSALLDWRGEGKTRTPNTHRQAQLGVVANRQNPHTNTGTIKPSRERRGTAPTGT